jgi:hypothetical protein
LENPTKAWQNNLLTLRKKTMNPVSTSRVFSIDAYRGFTMLAMISGGMGMGKLLKDPNWGWLADQFTHREWIGAKHGRFNCNTLLKGRSYLSFWACFLIP